MVKYCPFFSIVYATQGGREQNMIECQEENCGVYNGYNKECGLITQTSIEVLR